MLTLPQSQIDRVNSKEMNDGCSFRRAVDEEAGSSFYGFGTV
jgi:hypothetical protein